MMTSIIACLLLRDGCVPASCSPLSTTLLFLCVFTTEGGKLPRILFLYLFLNFVSSRRHSNWRLTDWSCCEAQTAVTSLWIKADDSFVISCFFPLNLLPLISDVHLNSCLKIKPFDWWSFNSVFRLEMVLWRIRRGRRVGGINQSAFLPIVKG